MYTYVYVYVYVYCICTLFGFKNTAIKSAAHKWRQSNLEFCSNNCSQYLLREGVNKNSLFCGHKRET